MNQEKQQLRPSLWRTCRIIACESRLQLLWTIFDAGELSVCELAHRTGMGNAQASFQLRALNARGLISFRREKMRVLYRAEANPAVDFSPQLLMGLRMCYEHKMMFSTVIPSGRPVPMMPCYMIDRKRSKALSHEEVSCGV